MLREGPSRPNLLVPLLSSMGVWGMLACQPARTTETAAAAPVGGAEPNAHEAKAQGDGPNSESTAAPSQAARGEDSEKGEKQIVLLEDGREPDPTKSLPRLSFSHLGMHIGGESNSSEAKRPWLQGIDAGQEHLLLCYRFVREPEAGGSYGVDLYVGGNGGAPEVRGSRQKIGGEEFDACMKQAFKNLNFHKPGRPTVFSYSLLFALDEK